MNIENLEADTYGLPSHEYVKSHRLTHRSGLFEKTRPLNYPKRVHSETRSKKELARIKQGKAYGQLMEKKFELICDELMESGIFPWLVSYKRAPTHENIYHQTNFKLRTKHPNGYEFFMRVQVASSRNHLLKYSNRPLEKGIILVIVSEITDTETVMEILGNAYRDAKRYPQECV